MKAFRLAALGAVLALAPGGAIAQVGTVGGYLPPPIPGPGSGSLYPGTIPPQQGNMGVFHRGNRHGGNGGVFILEDREYVPVIYERAPEAPPPPPAAAPAPPPEPRKPYVLGKSYSSLPGGCMKMIEDGASYFYCDGDWYRQIGNGHNAQYKAVAKP
jgi:hypothetical protein